MNVTEAIRTQRAVRTYQPTPLAAHLVRAILHAGRRAQSVRNVQPWYFMEIRERATLESLAATSPNLAHIAGSDPG